MAKRPALSEDSFLKHLFSPKRNLLPTGIRKRALAFTAGRSKARVAAYNRMSATSQEILRRSGTRDAYLAGTSTLADARKALRSTAVEKGFARGVKARVKAASRDTHLDDRVASYIARQLIDAGKQISYPVLRKNIVIAPQDELAGMIHWDAARITAYGSDGSKTIIIDAKERNPLWYHP